MWTQKPSPQIFGNKRWHIHLGDILSDKQTPKMTVLERSQDWQSTGLMFGETSSLSLPAYQYQFALKTAATIL